MIACAVSTIVAIPLLFATGGDAGSVTQTETVTASGTSADSEATDGQSTITAASGVTRNDLLSEVSVSNLFDAGARDGDDVIATMADDDGVAPVNVGGQTSNRVIGSTVPKGDPGGTDDASDAVAAIGRADTDSDAATVTGTDTDTDSSNTRTSNTRTSNTVSKTVSESAPATSAPPTTTPRATAAPTTAAPTTAAPATAPPTTAAPTTAAPATESPAASSGAPTAADWAQLRSCEAFGSYTIISGNGLYHGAYQFGLQTWDSTANSAGRSDLVGVLPSDASAADQDAMAYHLWTLRGPAPWPHCGQHLPWP